jgi:hypothetical protein
MQIDKETKIAIRTFCLSCDDPEVIERGMLEAAKIKIKYTEKWIALDRMKKLIGMRIGTTQVRT